MLTALIFMGGHISGGHFNPGVTFAIFLSGRNKISKKDTLIYWMVQCGGGKLSRSFLFYSY
jgi:aquaporin Z